MQAKNNNSKEKVDKILEIFNGIDHSPSMNMYMFRFQDLPPSYKQFLKEFKVKFKITGEEHDETIKKLCAKLDSLASGSVPRYKDLKQSDLDVGAWDIIKVLVAVIILPVGLASTIASFATGTDLCDISTKIKAKSYVKKLADEKNKNSEVQKRQL